MMPHTTQRQRTQHVRVEQIEELQDKTGRLIMIMRMMTLTRILRIPKRKVLTIE